MEKEMGRLPTRHYLPSATRVQRDYAPLVDFLPWILALIAIASLLFSSSFLSQRKQSGSVTQGSVNLSLRVVGRTTVQ
jgi:hypothetical protein